MGKNSKAPAAPDPAATAQAQATANAETARLQAKMNMVDQYSPSGSVTYQPIGDDRYRQDVSLTPEGQASFSSQQRIGAGVNQLAENQIGQIQSAVGSPIDFSSLPKITNDFSADRDAVTRSLIERNQPVMDRTRDRQVNQLANQGIMPGSEAYRNALDDLSRQENDFRLGAVGAGGAEQSRLAGLNNQSYDKMLQQVLLARSQPINEVGALMGTGQVSMPQASQPSQVAVNPTDVQGGYDRQYSGQLAQYNAKNSANNALMGAVFGAGGSLGAAALPLMFSDVRLKSDLHKTGESNGIPTYLFRYVDEPDQIYHGVIAQDVAEIKPEAVSANANGFLMVDYGKIGVKFERVLQ